MNRFKCGTFEIPELGLGKCESEGNTNPDGGRYGACLQHSLASLVKL